MNSLLVEIQTEELPPKALKKLSDAFSQEVFTQLKKARLFAAGLQDESLWRSASNCPFTLLTFWRILPINHSARDWFQSKIGIGADGKAYCGSD